MRMLITGAGGMLGLDLQAAAAAAGHDVVALTRAALDVSDGAATADAVLAAAPDVVVNCAAYTDVDGAETDPQTAHAVNGAGAGHVAAGAARAGAWIVQISTDYVFDGAKGMAYVESDPVHPLSVYGASKLAGERAVAEAAPDRHTIVRTSWLFGTGGACFPATMLRLAGERDVLTVVDDQVGCPTFTGHLAAALVELAETPPCGVVHLAAAGQCSWYEFAVAIFAAVGADIEVRRGTTAELGRAAARPAHSVLRTERGVVAALPAWESGLEGYLEARVVA